MSMIGHFQTIDEEDLASLVENPEGIHDLLYPDDDDGTGHLDIDKAWHTIHFVLTGDAGGGDIPLNFILAEGTQIGEEDVGYGPARAFSSSEVKGIALALSQIDEFVFRSRFSVDRMKEADIYPSFGHSSDEEEIPYFLEYFLQLRLFVLEASKKNKCLLVYLG